MVVISNHFGWLEVLDRLQRIPAWVIPVPMGVVFEYTISIIAMLHEFVENILLYEDFQALLCCWHTRPGELTLLRETVM